MELKTINPNGDNIVVSNLNNTYFFIFLKIEEIEFENKYHALFF
jgi:hypothetical protein